MMPIAEIPYGQFSQHLHRILVVALEKITRMKLNPVLTKDGCDIPTAADGLEAIGFLTERNQCWQGAGHNKRKNG
jgi:hypothetical protein